MHPMTTKLLARPRVNRQLDQILTYPLTVVRAPMGYGKTTAVREYMRVNQLEPIWLSLLGSGGSLAYCWQRLTTLISQRAPELGARLKSLGFPQDAPQLARIAELLCTGAYPAPTLVVVDDYQLIDCEQAANLLALITGERVEHLHIVILARDTPALPVTDLEQRGLCWVVGQEILQFRAQEIKEYFALMKCHAGEETIQDVNRQTGGWISGIYLIVRGLLDGVSMGQGESMDLLLDGALYSGYDEPTQLFLQKLSCLDAFIPEQVCYVFEDAEAGVRLLSLARGNAFLSYSSTLSAYKMTGLFQAFLQEKARQGGIDPRPYWIRAGAWFLERGQSVAAYDYLYRAGEVEAILRDLDREEAGCTPFIQFPQIQQIFEGLSEAEVFRWPLAALRYIRVTALSGPPGLRPELERKLGSMEAYFQTAPVQEDRRSRVLGEIHNTWVIVAFNDARAAVEHAERAVAYFQGRTSCIVSSETEFTFGAPELLYCYYRTPGALRETAEYISKQFHVLAQAVEGCGAGSEPLALAEYALETGDFDNVELNARKAIYLARLYRQTSIEICASFVLARLLLLCGKFSEGERMLSRLTEEVSSQDSSVLNTTMELCLAYVNSCFGKLGKIPAWLRENEMDMGCFFFQGVAFPYIICTRAVLLSGAFIRLEVLCQEFHKRFAIYNNQLGFVHNHILAAQAKERLYGIEAGCEELEKALILAAGDALVMPFAENALGILPMLRKVRCSKRVPQDFLARVTECCERYHQSISGLLPSAVTLTEREREILQMLARGMKHEEISLNLYISVPTVRYHVKNIYQKLKVNNKVSALQKAATLNLI